MDKKNQSGKVVQPRPHSSQIVLKGSNTGPLVSKTYVLTITKSL